MAASRVSYCCRNSHYAPYSLKNIAITYFYKNVASDLLSDATFFVYVISQYCTEPPNYSVKQLSPLLLRDGVLCDQLLVPLKLSFGMRSSVS